jgi:hypothetical protein
MTGGDAIERAAMKVRDRILVITDLFLGALWADDEFSEDEQKAVRKLLADLLGDGEALLPEAVEERIAEFDPLKIDLEAAADAREDEYLGRLGDCLGVERTAYSDLVLDYEIEELREHFEQLRVPPPPMVDQKGRSTKPPPPPIVEAGAAPVMNAPAAPPVPSVPGPPPMVPREDDDER